MKKADMALKTPSRRPALRPAGKALPKRRTQAERSEATRGQLIEAAISCLSELGYLEATVGVVAARAGVSRGAVQHHFGSRNDLLVAVVDDLGIALSRLKEISNRLPVAERVGKSIDQTWELLRSPHFRAVAQIWLAMRSDTDILADIKAKVARIERELDRQWLAMFSDIELPSEQIALVRHIALATLRGLSLRNIYRQEQSASAKEIEMLKAMIATTLTEK
jgi:AcrR family transcriptional regulator